MKVENVSKLYRLGEVGTGSLAHDVNRWWHKVRGKEDPYLKIGQVNDRTKAQRSEVRGQKSGQSPSDNSSTDNRQPTTDNSSLPLGLRPPTSEQPSLDTSSLTSDLCSLTSDYVFALRDLNFEVQQGEVLGIIGRNGAGKSTLLKILSRVTTPTTGQIKVKGRIASLLEVGTGFHPELTGRENIFLNGAILGMRKAEIKAKFDEIVDFSGCERYIDTPVKRYSSGMYVRLAFAVAAHLEPDILIIDEVLAVGDAEFQNRCIGKMQDVSEKHGRTVLFVSHSMPAVMRLCQRVVLLDEGQIQLNGDAQSVTTRYLNTHLGTSAERDWQAPHDAPGDEVARLKAVRILQAGKVTEAVDIRYPVIFEMEYWNLKDGSRLMVAANFFNNDDVLLFVTADFQEADWRQPRPMGTYVSRCEVPGNYLSEGIVRVMAEVCTREPCWQSHVREEDVVSFSVVDCGKPGSVRAGWGRPLAGVMRPMLNWETLRVSTGAS